MAEDWKSVTLAEVTEKIGSGATPRGGKSVYRRTGMAFIRSQNVEDGRFVAEGIARIGDEAARSLSNVAVRPGDALVNITGESVTRTCLVPEGILPARVSQHVAIVRPRQDAVDPKYLLYALLSPNSKTRLNQLSQAGATRRALTKSHLEKFSLQLPPLGEQRRIAGLLGALDDLAENDQSVASNLGRVCEAAFAQFIERARSQRQTRVVKFSDTVRIWSGGTPKTSVPEFWGGAIPWFSVVDAPVDDAIWVRNTEKSITEAGLAGSSAQLLPVGTTILSARGTVGKLGLTAVPMAMNQSCYGLSSATGHRGVFAYFTVKRMVSDLRQRAHGSVFSTITRSTLQSLECVMPSESAVSEFESSIEPMMTSMVALLDEAEHARNTRDALLPLLMSGRLRVGEVSDGVVA